MSTQNMTSVCLFGGALMCAGLSNNALGADVVIDGTLIQSTTNYHFVVPATGYSFAYGDTSFDTIDFTVHSDGNVILDILSFGAFNTFTDAQLLLYRNDGNPLTYANYLAFNDSDYSLDVFTDSAYYDPYMDIFLTAGEYTVVVASYNTFPFHVVNGYTHNGIVLTNDLDLIPTTAEYELAIRGDVSAPAIVPLPPAAFAGFGLLAGMGAYRRLRR